MAIDLTVVLTASVTGLAGYGGARMQGRVALAQSRAQTAQATVERDLTAQEKRQSAYHDLLDALRELQVQVYHGDPMTEGDLVAWNRTYQHLLNGVQLVGVEPVRAAARRLDEVLQNLGNQIPPDAKTFSAAMKAAYEASEEELTTCFRDLISTMSADVSPEAARSFTPPPPGSRMRQLRLLDSYRPRGKG